VQPLSTIIEKQRIEHLVHHCAFKKNECKKNVRRKKDRLVQKYEAIHSENNTDNKEGRKRQTLKVNWNANQIKKKYITHQQNI